MDKFKISALKKVDKQLKRIHPNDKKKVFEFFSKLTNSPFPKGSDIIKMAGAKDTYRVRLGKIRVIYTVLAEKKEIIITKVKYRKAAYRN